MSDESSDTEQRTREDHIRHTLSETRKCQMLTEVHTALLGSPFKNPPEPGALATLDKHDKVLFGTRNYTGLVKDNQRIKVLIWIGTGIIVAVKAATYLLPWFVSPPLTK